eukprot:gene38281-55638_t
MRVDLPLSNLTRQLVSFYAAIAAAVDPSHHHGAAHLRLIVATACPNGSTGG